MNIVKENVDELNAIVKVDIVADDYKDKVTKTLNYYRKTAHISGFRKGHVPMQMIRRQYGKAIIIDEVNKLLQESLNQFLIEEKLDILGKPLPKVDENFSWEAEQFSFEFELGLVPEFDVDLTAKKVRRYKIVANDEFIEKEVENIQIRYGKLIMLEEAGEDSNITGTFVNEEKEINRKTTFLVNDLKEKRNKEKLVGAKVGDVIELATKELFEKDKLQRILGISNDEIENLDVPVTFTIEEISKTEKATLNQELFDKLFADGSVQTVTALKEKMKEDTEKQFQQQADQQLLDTVTEALVENTKFELPKKFLQKWLQTAGEKELTNEEAINEYEKSEKALRYQLIEEKIIKDHDLSVDHTDLVEYTKEIAKMQMAQFGDTHPEEKKVNILVGELLSRQESAKHLQERLISQKLIAFFKENMEFDIKETSFEEFIKEVYSKDKEQ